MANFKLNWICVDLNQKISKSSFVDMSSKSRENTNQKTKISIFHVTTCTYGHRVFLPDDADLGSVTPRLSKNGLLIIEASRDPVLLPSNRNVEVSMEVDEPQPEEQAKQVANSDTEEQNKKPSEPCWQTAKPYLLPENSCLPFLTFLIKFCLGIKVIGRMHKLSVPWIIGSFR